jgi:thiol-disulfide isomerase/thioredoxin
MSSLPKSPLPQDSADARLKGNGSQPELVNAPAAQSSEEHGAVPADSAGQPPAGTSQPPSPGAGRNPLALVVVAVVAAGMLFFGFHMARRPGPEAPAILSKSTPAPDFTLESLDGKNMRLSDFHGKAVLLNFWATWCGPCKIEMPWFVDFQKEYGPQGLQIVGVAMDDSSKEDIAKFAKEMGVNYPVLLGKEAVGDEYGGVPALPESFFIGRDGKIVDKILGLKGKAEIEDSIKKALETSSAPASTTASATQPQK